MAPWPQYALNETTINTLIKLYLPGETQPVITGLWVVYGSYAFSLPIQDPYVHFSVYAAHVLPVSRLQLLLSNVR